MLIVGLKLLCGKFMKRFFHVLVITEPCQICFFGYQGYLK